MENLDINRQKKYNTVWINDYDKFCISFDYDPDYVLDVFKYDRYVDSLPIPTHSIVFAHSSNKKYRSVEICAHKTSAGLSGQDIVKCTGLYYVRGNPANRNITAVNLTYIQAQSLAYQIMDAIIPDDNICQVIVENLPENENKFEKSA